jgi:putative transposase
MLIYPSALIDWSSRALLGSELSNTLDDSFSVTAAARAMAGYGMPEIFTIDQDS